MAYGQAVIDRENAEENRAARLLRKFGSVDPHYGDNCSFCGKARADHARSGKCGPQLTRKENREKRLDALQLGIDLMDLDSDADFDGEVRQRAKAAATELRAMRDEIQESGKN